MLFLQKCLLNSFSHFIRLLSELLNLMVNFRKILFLKNISWLKVAYMFMALGTSLVVILLPCYCSYFDKTLKGRLLVFHCCGYTWAIVR